MANISDYDPTSLKLGASRRLSRGAAGGSLSLERREEAISAIGETIACC